MLAVRMAKKPGRQFFDPFVEVRREFYSGKRKFIDDLRDQLDENSGIAELIQKRSTRNGKPVQPGTAFAMITFDRKPNDNKFEYGYFDVLLVLLDALSGGKGIYKPINQLRVLHWNASRRDLLKVILFFVKNNPQIKARRILVLPYPRIEIGQFIDHRIYKR
jgi:hypothetical protein